MLKAGLVGQEGKVDVSYFVVFQVEPDQFVKRTDIGMSSYFIVFGL